VILPEVGHMQQPFHVDLQRTEASKYRLLDCWGVRHLPAFLELVYCGSSCRHCITEDTMGEDQHEGVVRSGGPFVAFTKQHEPEGIRQ